MHETLDLQWTAHTDFKLRLGTVKLINLYRPSQERLDTILMTSTFPLFLLTYSM